MIEIGKYNELKILRQTSVGLFLGNDMGDEVLLPNKYCTEEMKPGDAIRVFIYRDSEDRIIATTLTPKISMHEFALLKVTEVSTVGAFLEWGLEKDLMVPFREQRQKMTAGRWYVVFLDLDQKTDRLYASNKVEKFLQNDELSIQPGDKVSLVILQQTDLGYTVIINHKHRGLIFENDIFQEINIGDKLNGYVKQIRPDQKIDISLQPIGYKSANDNNSNIIINKLLENDGFIPLTDKSPPDEISTLMGMSKKAFKKSLGALYKQRKITIESEGIRLTASSD